MKEIKLDRFIAHKLVLAASMTLGEFAAMTNKKLDEALDPDMEGFMFQDDTNGVPSFKWSPSEVFLSASKPTEGMSFALAIECMKQGYRVRRDYWGDDRWITIVVQDEINFEYGSGEVETLPMASWIGMKQHNGNFSPFTPMGTDLLAEDWQIVDEPEADSQGVIEVPKLKL